MLDYVNFHTEDIVSTITGGNELTQDQLNFIETFTDDPNDLIPMWYKIWLIAYLLISLLITYLVYQHCQNCDGLKGFLKAIAIGFILAIIQYYSKKKQERILLMIYYLNVFNAPSSYFSLNLD